MVVKKQIVDTGFTIYIIIKKTMHVILQILKYNVL